MNHKEAIQYLLDGGILAYAPERVSPHYTIRFDTESGNFLSENEVGTSLININCRDLTSSDYVKIEELPAETRYKFYTVKEWEEYGNDT